MDSGQLIFRVCQYFLNSGFEVPGLLISLLPACSITTHNKSIKDPDLPDRVIPFIHYKDFLTIFNSRIRANHLPGE